jgi:hypothetical protein
LRAVIHLAGEPIANRRWSDAQKHRLRDSRVGSTRALVECLAGLERPPEVLICASATGYYGPRGEEELSEASAPGTDFLSQLCVDWEQEAQAAEGSGVRVVGLRSGVVLSAQGGALSRMLLPFRLGLGGPMGPAKRWFPWIHLDDVVGLVRLGLENPELRGPVNAVAPEAIRQGEFARAIGRALRRPAALPLPLPVLRVALGELIDGLVPGQKVIPRAALDAGYRFSLGSIEAALVACLGR